MLTKTKAKIAEKKFLNPETLFIKLKLQDPINFQAGQYIILDIPTEKGIQKRIYSIASDPIKNQEIELIVKLLPGGVASDFFRSNQINTEINVTGPAGLFVLKEKNKPSVFLATGTGIAPIRSMLLSLQREKLTQPYLLFWGMKDKKSLYLTSEFSKLEDKLKTLKVYYCLSRETSEDPEKRILKGHIQDVLPKTLSKDLLKTANFYICGGRNMVEDVKNFLLDLGIDKERIFFEKF